MATFMLVLLALYVLGKSTFIKNFMDLLVIPNIDNEYKKERARDELPQSAGGRTIMTTEPKFIPNEAVEITIGDNLKFKTRLVDCVGYLVNNAIGYLEDDMPRMVKKRLGMRKKYLLKKLLKLALEK